MPILACRLNCSRWNARELSTKREKDEEREAMRSKQRGARDANEHSSALKRRRVELDACARKRALDELALAFSVSLALARKLLRQPQLERTILGERFRVRSEISEK